MHSTIDNKGRVYVVCSECERGGNGSAVDKCSCGWKVKRYNKMGCFLGTLMLKYKKDFGNQERRSCQTCEGPCPNCAVTSNCIDKGYTYWRLKSPCTCGNPEFGFNCVCAWVKTHPGTREFECEFCGMYKASAPQCNKCQEVK